MGASRHCLQAALQLAKKELGNLITSALHKLKLLIINRYIHSLQMEETNLSKLKPNAQSCTF
jgi:hypothetical protein